MSTAKCPKCGSEVGGATAKCPKCEPQVAVATTASKVAKGGKIGTWSFWKMMAPFMLLGVIFLPDDRANSTVVVGFVFLSSALLLVLSAQGSELHRQAGETLDAEGATTKTSRKPSIFWAMGLALLLCFVSMLFFEYFYRPSTEWISDSHPDDKRVLREKLADEVLGPPPRVQVLGQGKDKVVLPPKLPESRTKIGFRVEELAEKWFKWGAIAGVMFGLVSFYLCTALWSSALGIRVRKGAAWGWGSSVIAPQEREAVSIPYAIGTALRRQPWRYTGLLFRRTIVLVVVVTFLVICLFAFRSAWRWYAQVRDPKAFDDRYGHQDQKPQQPSDPEARRREVAAFMVASFSQVLGPLSELPGSDRHDAYFGRGQAYAELGAFDKAIGDFNEAIRLSPNDAAAYFNRGLVWEKKGDKDKAISDLNKARQLDPKFRKDDNSIERK